MSLVRRLLGWLMPNNDEGVSVAATSCDECGSDLQQGRTDLTLESDGSTVVVTGVPAMICRGCNNAVVDDTTYAQLPDICEKAVAAGRNSGKREFVAEWKDSE